MHLHWVIAQTDTRPGRLLPRLCGLVKTGSPLTIDHPSVRIEVRIDHPVAAEARYRLLPNCVTVEDAGSVHGEDGLLDIVDQEAGAGIRRQFLASTLVVMLLPASRRP